LIAGSSALRAAGSVRSIRSTMAVIRSAAEWAKILVVARARSPT
jgi:hypothetical protein